MYVHISIPTCLDDPTWLITGPSMYTCKHAYFHACMHALHCTAFHCITSIHVTLHDITVHYMALHDNTLKHIHALACVRTCVHTYAHTYIHTYIHEYMYFGTRSRQSQARFLNVTQAQVYSPCSKH